MEYVEQILTSDVPGFIIAGMQEENKPGEETEIWSCGSSIHSTSRKVVLLNVAKTLQLTENQAAVAYLTSAGQSKVVSVGSPLEKGEEGELKGNL